MKDKPKLGRGLGDVSAYFLSRTREKEEKPGEVSTASDGYASAGVCCPGAGPLQACFLSNLALEAARRRHPVTILDRSGPEESRVTFLMRSVLAPDESEPGTACVRLYGLPEIRIVSGDVGEPGPASAEDGGRVILVNAADSLESLAEGEGPSDWIFITAVDEKSLLRTYAFIRKVLAANGAAGIHVIFAVEPDGVDEKPIQRRFSGFIEKSAGCSVHYLGRLVQDEELARSMADARPLVLSQSSSGSRSCLVEICSRFFSGIPAGPSDEGMGGSCAS